MNHSPLIKLEAAEFGRLRIETQAGAKTIDQDLAVDLASRILELVGVKSLKLKHNKKDSSIVTLVIGYK